MLIAEPSEYVRTLMQQPITMLDWGMFKMEKSLQESSAWSHDEQPDWFHVSYEWEGNKIAIYVVRNGEFPSSYEDAESVCKDDYKRIDQHFLVTEGKLQFPKICKFCDMFSHGGWTNEQLSAAKVNVINDAIVEVVVGNYRCSRELLATEFSISKQW